MFLAKIGFDAPDHEATDLVGITFVRTIRSPSPTTTAAAASSTTTGSLALEGRDLHLVACSASWSGTRSFTARIASRLRSPVRRMIKMTSRRRPRKQPDLTPLPLLDLGGWAGHVVVGALHVVAHLLKKLALRPRRLGRGFGGFGAWLGFLGGLGHTRRTDGGGEVPLSREVTRQAAFEPAVSAGDEMVVGEDTCRQGDALSKRQRVT